MSIKVWQTVIDVQPKYGTCLVESAKGNTYPAEINRLNKTINIGDKALVTKTLSGEWIVINVEHKYPRPLDIVDFPKAEDGCFNWIAYCEYLDAIEDMKPSERVEFDNYLKEKWGNTQ